jgi:hypothetical protein
MAPPAPFATLDLGPGQTVSTLTESSVATNYSGTSFDVLNHSGYVNATADLEGYYSW